MSNPTTPFSWQMPTATDLVTDLPADFEVFGQAVATSMADLLGGTTGQVLSKTSNTDMDFTWVAANPGDITGVTAGTGISGGGTSGTVTITNSMATEITAKGDLIAGTGSATFDNLPVGTNGQTLVADSSTSTGLKWATPATSASGLNLITPTSIANSGGSASLSGALVSASGVTSVSVNGVFTSTYTNYMILVYETVLNGTAAGIFMRMRASGTDTVGTSYKYGQMYALFTGSTGGYGGTAAGGEWDITGSTATGENASTIFIQNPQAAKNTSYQSNQTRYDAAGFAAGRLENTTSYDGFTIFMNTANLNTKIRVYGISN